jgi:hypothetical protein
MPAERNLNEKTGFIYSNTGRNILLGYKQGRVAS